MSKLFTASAGSMWCRVVLDVEARVLDEHPTGNLFMCSSVAGAKEKPGTNKATKMAIDRRITEEFMVHSGELGAEGISDLRLLEEEEEEEQEKSVGRLERWQLSLCFV